MNDIARRGLSAFLLAREMTAPDGRSLHQYKTTDDELQALQWYAQAHENFQWKPGDCAVLMLALCEWGYRNVRTARGFLEHALQGLLPQPPVDLTEFHTRLATGARMWQLPIGSVESAAWNSTLILESGYPMNYPHEGLAAFIENVGTVFNWPAIAAISNPSTLRNYVAGQRPNQPHLLGSDDDVLFISGLVHAFAKYSGVLARMDLLPARHEIAEAWVHRIRPLAAPNYHLPFRIALDPLFVKAFYPQLRRLESYPRQQWLIPTSTSDTSLTLLSKETPALGRRAIQIARDGKSSSPELQLLTQIRARSKPGKPLYTYRVTADELKTLRREIVRDLGRRSNPRSYEAGRFCLFAAEQLCRSYSGGSWTWKPVLDALDWAPQQSELAAAVQAGLDFWERPIVITSNHQRLLSTLVSEGGLPLNVLAEDRERHIKLFFRALIELAERHQVSARRFVDEQIALLPKSFRNPTVADLSWQLADAIVALRVRLPTGLTSDPVSYLESVDPDWHVNIPLNIETATFGEFLSQLLGQPRETLRAEDPLEVATVLHRAAPTRIERRAVVPDEITVDGMARLFGLTREQVVLHARLLLSLLTVTGERHPIAIARLNHAQTRYQLERQRLSPVRDEQAVRECIRLSASVGEQEIAFAEVPGGEPLLADVPWVFEGGERDFARMLGQGSVRHRGLQLLVLSPSTVTARHPQPGEVTPVGDYLSGGRALFAVSGRVVWSGGDDEWTIATGLPKFERRFSLSGTLSRCGFSGSEYWLGLPGLMETGVDGKRTTVPSTKVQARTQGSHVWRDWGSVAGELDIRVREGNETVFRGRATVVSASTRITIDTRRNTVSVCCADLTEARLGLGPLTQASDGRCDLSLPAGCADTVVSLELFLRSGRCTLTVPAPIRAARFIGREGAITGPVVFDRLRQVRARVISPVGTERFVLEGRIKGKTKWLQLSRIPHAGSSEGVWELGLGALQDHVEDLFATSSDLDAEVELRLDTPNGLSGGPTLKVRRYEERPQWRQRDDETVEITLPAEAIRRIGPMGMQLLEIELRPLHEPDQSPRPVTRVAEDCWTIASSDLAEAPSWLITGTIRQRVRLRPLLLPSPTFDRQNSSPSELLRLLAETRATVRQEGFVSLVKDMASDWSRPEWDQLSPFLESMNSLPPTTFDVLGAMAEVPEAATAALFRCSGSELTFRKIWQGFEKLPFLWAQVPLSAWVNTARCLGRWTAEASGNNAERTRLLVRMFTRPLEDAQRMSPLLQAIHDLFHSVTEHVSAPPSPLLRMPAVVLTDLLRDGAQALMRRHSEDWWPMDFADPEFMSGRSVQITEIDRALAGLGVGLHQPVFKIPAMLGFAAGSDEMLKTSSLLAARRIRTFDPVWFDEASAIGFVLGASPRLERRK